MEERNDILSEEEREELLWQVKWHLLQDQLVLQERLLQNGGELMMDDRYLQDFTMPWKGVPDVEKVPEWYAKAFQKQQQKNSTTITLGEGDVQVTYDDMSDRVYIATPRGTAEIEKDDLAALISTLQAIPTVGVTMRQAPAYEKQPNVPGYLSQAEKNDAAYDYAIQQERKRQDAVIAQNKAELRHRRW